ncbi:MAG: AAA family ATPase [Ignavibacteriales bacterium]
MYRRVVIDGPEASGKTTLLFGISKIGDSHHHCCKDFGCQVFAPSWNFASLQMQQQGKEINQNTMEALMRSIVSDMANYCYPYLSKTHFFEKSLCTNKLIAEELGTALPEYFDSLCRDYFAYYPKVFILKPLESLTCEPGDAVRKQKELEFKRICSLYKSFGYEVITVPVYSENIDKSCLKRLEKIFSELKKDEQIN